MSIRFKLLMLLLLLSIVPLLFVNVFSIWSMNDMGLTITDHSSRILIGREKVFLHEKISDTASILNKDLQLLRLSVLEQAREVEQALGAAPAGKKVVMASAFDSGEIETVTESIYSMPNPDGSPLSMPVSFETSVFVIAPGIEEERAREDIARLSGMTETYRRIHENNPSRIIWQYTSLESGVHNSFPGHGSYPENYDPRLRPWYIEAVKTGTPVFTRPVKDATTGRLVNTIAVPVHWPDGRVAGVTAIDFIIPVTLQAGVEQREKWAPQTVLLIVEMAASGKLAVLAEQLDTGGAFIWDRPEGDSYINDPGGRLYASFSQAAGTPAFSFHENVYRDEAYIWSYTPLAENNTFLLAGVPLSQVVAGARDSEKYVRSRFYFQSYVMAAAMVLLAVSVFVIAFFTAENVTTPLRELSRTAERITEGELESRVSFKRDDEIGSLGKSVNVMAANIEALIKDQESAHMQMLRSLSKALAAKDAYTSIHSARVAKFAVKLGRRLSLDEKTVDLLKRGALTHDLGKIGVPDNILNKSGPLDDDEYTEICKHPVETATIMRPLVRFKSFAEIAAWHHEHWDGSGYPDGLAGEEIPLLARIVSIADTWDAMTGDRVYRKGMSAETALARLEKELGSGQFDPGLLREFIDMIREDMVEDNEDTDTDI